jgi:hypothetical protein
LVNLTKIEQGVRILEENLGCCLETLVGGRKRERSESVVKSARFQRLRKMLKNQGKLAKNEYQPKIARNSKKLKKEMFGRNHKILAEKLEKD